ncbi:hypothetical protein Lal_00004251, partial [Lupinus albus]
MPRTKWAIKLATEAARTVLSVDQIIVARQAGGPKPPGPNPITGSKHGHIFIQIVQYPVVNSAVTWITRFCLTWYRDYGLQISIANSDAVTKLS